MTLKSKITTPSTCLGWALSFNVPRDPPTDVQALPMTSAQSIPETIQLAVTLAEYASNLTLEQLGEGFKDASTNVDNARLIEVNEAIRSHGVETIGKELRGYMKDMKKIASAK